MPGSVQPDEQLEWERRAGRPAGLAAIAAAVFLVLGGVLNARISDLLEVERYQRINGDPALVIVPYTIQILGYLAVAVALYYLARATAARRSEMSGPMRTMALLGPLATALSALLVMIAVLNLAGKVGDLTQPRGLSDRAGGAANLLGNNLAGEDAFNDLKTDSGLFTGGAYIALAANLALGFGLVLVSLNAMRAGLLSRFVGILGVIAGVLTVLFQGAGVIEAFWLGALGVLFLGRWPGGRGPAWGTVESIPWPSAVEQRAARLEEEGDGGDEDDYEEEPVSAVERDEGQPAASDPHPASKKRKRKRRR